MIRYGHYRTYSDMQDEFTNRFGEQKAGEYVKVEEIIKRLKEIQFTTHGFTSGRLITLIEELSK